MKRIITLFVLLVVAVASAQTKGMSFSEAKTKGNLVETLDKNYKSALHSDVKLAVFKSEEEQQKLIAAYTKLLQDFGAYLKAQKFLWGNPVRCFNRIYINKNGTIDHFLYQFNKGDEKTAAELTPAKEKEFERLLNAFVQNYSFDAKANEDFAQCSPVVYKN